VGTAISFVGNPLKVVGFPISLVGTAISFVENPLKVVGFPIILMVKGLILNWKNRKALTALIISSFRKIISEESESKRNLSLSLSLSLSLRKRGFPKVSYFQDGS